jgi:hypothetical protein
METLLRIPVSDETFNELDFQAKMVGIQVEQLIAQRLPQLTKVSSEKPVVLSDDERREIERLIAKNITTGQDLIAILRRILVIDLDGLDIELQPRLLERLKTRCIGVSFDEFMKRTVKRLLEEHAGLR